MAGRFKLCTFDVTNTLLKFRLSVGEQYARVGRIYGVEREPHQITRAFQYNWKLMNLNHPNYGQNSGLTSQEWWKFIVQKVFIHDNSELNEKQLDSISSHLYDLYKNNSCWEVASGTEMLLKLLKQNKVILGVISNFDERLDHVLTSTGLKSYFDFVLASYVVKVAKPNKKIFDIALGNVNDVSPSEALHIGDNIKLDYLAAKGAGWNALLIARKNFTPEEFEQLDPKDIIYDLEQIKGYILTS